MWQDILKRKKKKRKTSPCCYRKVSARYKGGPSAYRSGAMVTCDKVGCANWGEGKVKKEDPHTKKEREGGLHAWFRRRD